MCICEIPEKQILDTLHAVEIPASELLWVGRNTHGDQLRVRWSGRETSKMASIDAARGLQTVFTPGTGQVYPTDELHFAAWLAGGDIRFATGDVIASTNVQFFAIDPGGTYFLLRPDTGQTEIRRADKPLATVFKFPPGTEADECEWIFTGSDVVYVLSRTYSERKGPGEYVQDGLLCHSFQIKGETIVSQHETRIPVPRPSIAPFIVLDMDTQCRKILIAKHVDPPFAYLRSTIYLFDLETSTISSLGSQGDNTLLFLTAELCEQLGSSQSRTKVVGERSN